MSQVAEPDKALLKDLSEFLLARGRPVTLKGVADMLEATPEAHRKTAIAEALELSKDMPWVPNPGPQFVAYYSEADETGFGGEAGGGKSDLAVGLSITAHQRSLVLRRTNKEADKMVERFVEVLGTRAGWNSQDNVWRRPDGRIIDIGGCQNEDDKQKYKGNPHDLIFFDQLEDFSKTQYEFIITWNRSADAKQRCRVVSSFNPPTTPEGLWVLDRFAAWLDPRYVGELGKGPAKSGEIRWFTRDPNGLDIEVDGPGPHQIGGEIVFAKSRTFIRSTLADNEELESTGYGATLAALPSQYRDAFKGGNFETALKDQEQQCIPLAWVRAAQARWTPRPPAGIPMCALGVDASGGGTDPMEIAIRHDGWFAPLIEIPAKQLDPERMSSQCAGIITGYRKNRAGVMIDCGGGYGSGTYERLRENDIDVKAYKGANASNGRTRPDSQYGFVNKRTELYWRFREALDPDHQDFPGGSTIALPDDRFLVAELCAPTFKEVNKVIVLEPKEDVVKRLGRSPNKADAVVMAWAYGPKYITDGEGWAKDQEQRERARASGQGGRRPQVQFSARQQRARRR